MCMMTKQCMVQCALMSLGYVLIVSALMMVTWNKVIVAQTKLKPVKFWHALLLLVTLLALTCPKLGLRRGMYMKSDCHHGECKSGECDNHKK